MYRDQVIAILRAHEPELRAAGVEHLRLFGSVARGEQTHMSDVDVAVELRPDAKPGMFTMGRLQMDLADWLAAEVDLSLLSSFRSTLRQRVLKEAIDVL